jgi:hypothetical protein
MSAGTPVVAVAARVPIVDVVTASAAVSGAAVRDDPLARRQVLGLVKLVIAPPRLIWDRGRRSFVRLPIRRRTRAHAWRANPGIVACVGVALCWF